MTRTITEQQLIRHIAALAKRSSNAEVAKQIGFSPAYVGEIIKGNRAVSKEVAARFGYEEEPRRFRRIK